MSKEVITVPELFSYDEKFGFTQCVAMDRLIFITGQSGIDKKGRIISEDIEKQTEATFNNIQYALKAAGSDLKNILSMTCFIVDIKKNGPQFWEVRKRMMPTSSYTSATIGIVELADPKLLIEIQCTAFR
jgi:2-iminobutanoate/2-iminopropanoate deaminase